MEQQMPADAPVVRSRVHHRRDPQRYAEVDLFVQPCDAGVHKFEWLVDDETAVILDAFGNPHPHSAAWRVQCESGTNYALRRLGLQYGGWHVAVSNISGRLKLFDTGLAVAAANAVAKALSRAEKIAANPDWVAED